MKNRITTAEIFEIRNCDDPAGILRKKLDIKPYNTCRVVGTKMEIKDNPLDKQINNFHEIGTGKIGLIFYLSVNDDTPGNINMAMEKKWVWITNKV